MEKSMFILSFGFLVLILATQHSFAQTAQCCAHKDVLAVLTNHFHDGPPTIGGDHGRDSPQRAHRHMDHHRDQGGAHA